MKKLFKILAACVFVCAMAVSCSSPSSDNPVIIGEWYKIIGGNTYYTAAITENKSNYGASIVVAVGQTADYKIITADCTKNESTYESTSIWLDGVKVENRTMKIVIQQSGDAIVSCDLDCVADDLRDGADFFKPDN